MPLLLEIMKSYLYTSKISFFILQAHKRSSSHICFHSCFFPGSTDSRAVLAGLEAFPQVFSVLLRLKRRLLSATRLLYVILLQKVNMMMLVPVFLVVAQSPSGQRKSDRRLDYSHVWFPFWFIRRGFSAEVE